MSPWIPLAVFAAVWIVMQVLRARSQVSPEKAKALVSNGATLVDVRSPGEFAGGHVAGAKNVPVGELAARAAGTTPQDKPVVVYCASGVRSARAASLLKAAGYADVHDLGGMHRWRG